MQQQIRPIPAMEAAATTWGVAALVGFGAFGALFLIGDWTFLQAAFAGAVVLGALGLLLALTVGRVVPADALDHRPPTRRVSTPEPELVVALDAMRPRDLNKPSPHKDGIDQSVISDTEAGKGLNGPTFRQPIRGTIESAPATRVPSPAPINATDPGVARPVGATANPQPMSQPAPLNGRIVSPEPPVQLDGSSPGTVSRNEAALAAGAAVTVRPTATHSAQSYNEPGAGDDTVVASGGTIPESSPASPGSAASNAVDGASGSDLHAARDSIAEEHPRTADDPMPIPGPKPDAAGKTSGSDRHATRDSIAEEHPRSADDPMPIPGPKPDAPGGTASAAEEAEKPATLEAPRDGSGDDLKKIKGVGPKLEAMLNDMGFWHFSQIGAWTDKEVAWVDQNLEGFKGRVTRDDWVPQARALAGGGETDFSRKVDEGDVY